MLRYFFFSFFLWIFTTSAVSAQSRVLEGLVERIIRPYLEEEHAMPIQVGIIERGHTYYYQFEKEGGSSKMNIDSSTLYSVGSLTKTFTSALLAAMVEDRVVRLEDVIVKYLPDSVATANQLLQKITLKQLASHTSSLPKTSHNLPLRIKDKAVPYADYHLSDVHQFLMDYRPSMNKKRLKALKKGEEMFLYSHFGMGLLGHILESAGEKPYAELLQKYIFEPLKLKDTDMLQNLLPDESLLKGHDFVGNPTPQQSFASLYASEGLLSSLRDLLQFVRCHMENESQFSFLKECLKKRSHTDKKNVGVGLSWFIIRQGNPKKYPPIYTHSAKLGGFSTYMAFIEETQTAVVVMSNCSKRVDDFGIQILELINR